MRLYFIFHFLVTAEDTDHWMSKFPGYNGPRKIIHNHHCFLLTHEVKHVETWPRSHGQFLVRLTRRPGSLGLSLRNRSFLPWNLTFNTLKLSVKSKHNYIKNLALLLMKPNRKIYCSSEAVLLSTREPWQQRKITTEYFWGGKEVQRSLWIIKSLPTQTDPHFKVQIQLIRH